MPTQFPAFNDREFDLQKKIVNNTALLADAEAGDVASITGTANRITASPSTGAVVLDISSAYVGQTSITTLGTITTGVWSGTTIVDGKIASALTGKTYNGLTVTSTTGVLTIADGQTLTVTTGGTLGTAAYTAASAYATSGAITSSGLTMTSERLLGRTTASTGAVQEITVGANLSLASTSLALSATLAAITSITSATGAALTLATLDSNANVVVSPNGTGYLKVGGSNEGQVRLHTSGDIENVRIRASGVCFFAGGNVLFGTGTDSSNGKIQVTNHSTSAGGLGLGTGAFIYANSSGGANITTSGSITTSAPTTGTAGAWKFGIRVAAVVGLDTTQYIQLDVGGTLYKVALAT